MDLAHAKYHFGVWVFLAFACAIAAAQDDTKVSEPKDPNDPLKGFSITEYKFARLATRARELAIRECCDLLESRAKEKAKRDSERDIQVAYAAKLLGELRPTDSQCIDALCKNITLQPEFVVSDQPWRPLNWYPVARSLVAIGGREAAEGIIRHMKNKLDRRELLICAHVLNLIDYHLVTFERMRIAKEQSRLEDPPEVREVFWDNLAQVKQWIEDPRFETDEKFRP